MGLFSDLYHNENDFQFWQKRWITYALSGALVVIGLVSLVAQGLNLGIDFRGGSVWEVPTATLSIADARDALRDDGLADAKIQEVIDSRTGKRVLRVAGDVTDIAKAQQVAATLADAAKVDVNGVNRNSVGPSWGQEITSKAIRALVVFFLLIVVYISARFEPKMALAALIAVFHDVLLSVGVYSVLRLQVTPATVVAFLTILGFSLYDTIVVFDKVRENVPMLAGNRNLTYSSMVNRSMNQVVMRSLNTSAMAVLPVFSLLIVGSFLLGATTLQEFAFALLVGLVAGAYSSIFIAAPLLTELKEREPRYAERKRRVEAATATKPSKVTKVVPDDESAGADADGEVTAPAAKVSVGASLPAGGVAPRPRKQRRKR